MLEIIHSILHLDITIQNWAQNYGSFLYFLLFLIIFCETGLVVTPFLPGDSLLFAAGALCATSGSLEVKFIIPLLIIAALAGDSMNYFLGRRFGRNIFSDNSYFFKKKYLVKTEDFYAKHGTRAVFLARFFPILRTFAPFVAGLGNMRYRTFFTMSFAGTVTWILIFTLAGYFFGQLPFIQKNFTLLVMALLIVPAIPIVITALKPYFNKPQKNID